MPPQNNDNIHTTSTRVGTTIIQTFIDAMDYSSATDKIITWSKEKKPRSVCLCNVHSCVTAYDNKLLSRALASSDMVLPDGAPIAWVMRRKEYKKQRRVAGPDLMLTVCNQAQESNIKICLFGSTEETLTILKENLITLYPALEISKAISPKFGEWRPQEEDQYIKSINDSDAGIIFVGLGCPKQEIWMINNKDKIHGVLIGVGAAFDFHAGAINRAPIFLQKLGLEWLHRLLSEPERLWKRYLFTNTKFIWLIFKSILAH